MAALFTGCSHLPSDPAPPAATILDFEAGQFIEKPYEDPFVK